MQTPPPDTHERTEGPTPNGGAYAIAYFRGADGNPTTKDRAAAMEIVEFDDQDREVWRTYMSRPDDRD